MVEFEIGMATYAYTVALFFYPDLGLALVWQYTVEHCTDCTMCSAAVAGLSEVVTKLSEIVRKIGEYIKRNKLVIRVFKCGFLFLKC